MVYYVIIFLLHYILHHFILCCKHYINIIYLFSLYSTFDMINNHVIIYVLVATTTANTEISVLAERMEKYMAKRLFLQASPKYQKHVNAIIE